VSEDGEKRGSGGKGRGCCLGWSIGCLIVLVVSGILAFVGVRFVREQYDAVMARFEREGYQRVEQRVIDLDSRVGEPTIFIGESVTIRHGSDRAMAIVAATAEIDGDILGNVHFYGGELTVLPTARLRRDLHLKCVSATVRGRIDGEITGVYGSLDKDSRPADD